MTVSRSLPLTLVVALLALLAVQVVRWRSLPPLAGPMRGDTLPAVLVERLPGRDTLPLAAAVVPGGRCGLAYIMSTHCPFCNRMRATWQAEYPPWAENVGEPVDILWVLDTDVESTRAWAADWHLPGVTLATLISDRAHAWRRLGVLGTPIAYLVSRSGRVVGGIAGPALPPAELVRGACGGASD